MERQCHFTMRYFNSVECERQCLELELFGSKYCRYIQLQFAQLSQKPTLNQNHALTLLLSGEVIKADNVCDFFIQVLLGMGTHVASSFLDWPKQFLLFKQRSHFPLLDLKRLLVPLQSSHNFQDQACLKQIEIDRKAEGQLAWKRLLSYMNVGFLQGGLN